MSNPNVTINRQKYVGGSDLPNILGYNLKYDTSVFKWAKIKAGIIPNEFKGNEYTKYGQLMEPVIREYINAINGINFIEDTVVDEPRLIRGNCDGIDREAKLLLEVKTYGGNLDVEYYTPQIQMYLEMFDIEECLLVGYERPIGFYTGTDYDLENDDIYFDLTFDEARITVDHIKRDKTLWDKIYTKIVAFQKGVEELKNDPTMSEDDFNKIMYGTDLITLKNEVNRLEIALTGFKEIEEEYKSVKDKLYKAFDIHGIKTFDTGLFRITKVDPSSSTKDVIDEKLLKQNEPKIYAKYVTTKTTNRKGYMLITARKENKEELLEIGGNA